MTNEIKIDLMDDKNVEYFKDSNIELTPTCVKIKKKDEDEIFLPWHRIKRIDIHKSIKR